MKEETQENQMQTGELIKVLPVRYGYLDFWKYIAAIGVIFVHAPLPGVWGTLWTTVGVCGVGFFYIITGSACCGPDKDLVCHKILKRLVRNGIITIITIAVYFAFAWIYSRHNHALYPLKRAMKLPVTYARMFLLGDFEFMYGSPLWFMIALLYCYVIFYVIVRFDLKKLVYIMTVPLLILRIVVDTWVNSYPVSWHWSANLIVGALPMVCLGYIIADQKEKLALIPAWKLTVCCLVSAAAMFLTSIFSVGKLNISQPFKILCGASLFVLCINNPQRHLCRFVESCGRHDSLLVYLSHFLILIIVSELMYSMPHLPKHMDWIVPLTVAAVSLVFARIVSIVILHYYKCHCRGP